MSKKGRKRKEARGGAGPSEGEDRAARRRRPGGTAPPSSGGADLPRWVAPALFVLVTVVLFRKFVFSDAMLFGADTNALGYAARAFFAEAVTGQGVFPRWNPYILGGTPFLESLAGGDSLYPTALLLFVMEPYRALGWKLVVHVLAAGLFMYGWTRALGTSRAAALVAGLAYLLAPYMVSLVLPGHDGKIFVTALTPLLFWAAERSLAGRGLAPFVGVSLVVALVILTTHFQMAYFLFGGVGLYYLARCAQLWRGGGVLASGAVEGGGGDREQAVAGQETPDARGPRTAVLKLATFLVASVLGAGVAGVQLIPAVDYVTEFSRRTSTTTTASAEEGVAYSSSWSLHPEEVVSLAVPEFVGNTSLDRPWGQGTYWGRNPFKSNHEYVGLVVLLLATVSFFGGRRPWIRWSLAGVGAVALLYTLGGHTPVWRIFYELVPGVRLFRAPSIAVFLFGFAATTLAALGLDRAFELWGGRGAEGDRDLRRSRWALLGWLGVLALASALAAGGSLGPLWTSLFYSDIDAGKAQALQTLAPHLTRGFSVAVLLAGALLATLWALGRGLLQPVGVAAVVALLVLLDMFRIADPYVRTQELAVVAAPDPNVQLLVDRMASEPPFRVLSFMDGGNVGQDVAPAVHGLELAGGHHPNDLARYRELIGMVGSGVPANFFDRTTGELDTRLSGLLNVRYLLWPAYRYASPMGEAEPVSVTSFPDGRPFSAVYRMDDLPRARLVSTVRVADDERAVDVLLSEDFDPATEVVLPEPLEPSLPPGPAQGSVDWVERGLNRQTLDVESDREALLVVADNWFPAWHATVDGAEVPLLRANHTLRGVRVPAGLSRVSIQYRSGVLRAGLALSFVSLLLVALAGAPSIVAAVRARRAPGGDG